MLNQLYAQSPGGVSTNIKLWYKADVGVKLGASNATDGQAIDTWENQISTYLLTQATSTRRPVFYNTTANQQINYNPSLRFDGTDDFIGNTASFMTATSAYSFFIVEIDSAADGNWRAIMSAQSAGYNIFNLYKQGAASATYFNRIIPYGVSGYDDFGSFGKGTTYSSYNGAYWNGSTFTSDATVNKAQAQVIGMRSTNNLGTDPFITYTDGYKDGPNYRTTWSYINENTTYRPYFFGTFFLGADACLYRTLAWQYSRSNCI